MCMFRFSKNIFYPFTTLVVDNQLYRVGYIVGREEVYEKEESGRRSQLGYGQIGKKLECHAEGLVLIQQKWKAMRKNASRCTDWIALPPNSYIEALTCQCNYLETETLWRYKVK